MVNENGSRSRNERSSGLWFMNRLVKQGVKFDACLYFHQWFNFLFDICLLKIAFQDFKKTIFENKSILSMWVSKGFRKYSIKKRKFIAEQKLRFYQTWQANWIDVAIKKSSFTVDIFELFALFATFLNQYLLADYHTSAFFSTLQKSNDEKHASCWNDYFLISRSNTIL